MASTGARIFSSPAATALSRRLLTLLQLTRMALVFTAIADSQCELLLSVEKEPKEPYAQMIGALVILSAALYGFGMSLNDIIDRRRDAQIAAGRPLPSGRISVVTAHVICGGLIATAAVAGVYFARLEYQFFSPGPNRLWAGASIALLVVTAGLITFYDFAGKYLTGLGLLSLGLIRFCHCLIAAPWMPVPWHALWLLNHVTILSTVAYDWEEKRPPLKPGHWWGVFGALAGIDLAFLCGVAWRRYDYDAAHPILRALDVTWWLLLPVAASLAFVALAAYLRRTSPTRRAAGQKLMLFGLLWLILYDAAFAGAYVDVWAAIGLLSLLPLAYASVQVMRWWSQLVLISQKPQYQRAEGAENVKRTT